MEDRRLVEIVDLIESKIFSKNKGEISSKEVGKLIIKELKKDDEVAYLRFISVYRSFGSLASFDKEIKKLKLKKDLK
jgi:transcriptional repressor NrdR